MVKLDQQHAKDILMVNKWRTKANSNDEMLTSLEGKLKVLQSEPASQSNVQTLLHGLQVGATLVWFGLAL